MAKKSPKNYPKELPNCEHCGIVIDRDVNTAINIKNKLVYFVILTPIWENDNYYTIGFCIKWSFSVKFEGPFNMNNQVQETRIILSMKVPSSPID